MKDKCSICKQKAPEEHLSIFGEIIICDECLEKETVVCRECKKRIFA